MQRVGFDCLNVFRGPVEVWILGFGCRQACRRSVDVQRVGLKESVFTPGKRVGGL